MNYTIEVADINDPLIESELRVLIQAAFNSPDQLPEKHLLKNISSHASMPSFFLVAKEEGKIIGCNAFLANDFYLHGKNYVAYQSCWTATHPAHQGKKVFVNIINEAKKLLKEKGAGFLYGIPNNTSHPVFVKKLDFSETPALIARIPNVPFLKKIFLTDADIDNSKSCFINEEQVKEHKLLQFPSAVKAVSYNKSRIWGKFSKKTKFGIQIPYFEVGGIHLDSNNDLEFLLKEIFKKYKVWFVQIISCKTNTFNALIKNWKPAGMNGFIFHNLNMPVFEHFDVMIGTIDVF